MTFKHNSQNLSFSLFEASRKDLISKSRKGSKERYNKRLNYQVVEFRGVDLDKFFNQDYFVYETPVNDYTVTIAFPGVLTELKNVVKSTNGNIEKINFDLVLKALRIALDKTDDLKVRCTCDDFKYRFMYWAIRNKYLYGPPVAGTGKFPKKTNPDDALGAVCKHLDLFLSNKRWLVKAASVVTSLIKAYPEKAALYLYDPEELKEPEDEIDEPVEDTTDEVEVDAEISDDNIEVSEEETTAEEGSNEEEEVSTD